MSVAASGAHILVYPASISTVRASSHVTGIVLVYWHVYVKFEEDKHFCICRVALAQQVRLVGFMCLKTPVVKRLVIVLVMLQASLRRARLKQRIKYDVCLSLVAHLDGTALFMNKDDVECVYSNGTFQRYPSDWNYNTP